MSYDFNTTPSPCDHMISSERLLISTDNLHLYSFEIPSQRMTSPINGETLVTLRINDVPVPRNHPRYGWDILPDELVIAPDQRSKIKFKQPVRQRDFLIEVSYVTLAQYCLKCRGAGLMTDFSVGQDGSWAHIVRRKKLVQRCLKVVMTSRCAFYPAVTCKIRDFIGRKATKSHDTDAITWEITNALQTLTRIQTSQAKYQVLDKEEVLASLTEVRAIRDPKDPRLVRVKIEVASASGTTDQINVGIKN